MGAMKDMLIETVENDMRSWEGPGAYVIMWSDGGSWGDIRWYEDDYDLFEDMCEAYSYATETHLPYIERVFGNEEINERWAED